MLRLSNAEVFLITIPEKRPAANIIRCKTADIKGNNKRIKQVSAAFSAKPHAKTIGKKSLDFFGKKLYNNMYVFFRFGKC